MPDGTEYLRGPQGLRGIIPDEVRLNRLRGLQAADLGKRLLASRNELSDALSELDSNPLANELLDLPKMRQVLDALEHRPELENRVLGNSVLLRGLAAGRFLCLDDLNS